MVVISREENERGGRKRKTEVQRETKRVNPAEKELGRRECMRNEEIRSRVS